MARTSAHLHGNLLAVVDVETTGLDPDWNEIHQVAVLPLDSQLNPNKHYIPFCMDIKIQYPDRINKRAISLTRGDFADRQIRALDQYQVADLLDEWFQKLKLPIGKRLVPLAHNWPFDRNFIMRWLGKASFEDFFHHHHRDSMAVVNFIKDVYDWKSEQSPFTYCTLSHLCYTLGITNLKAHDALQDCVATAEVYKRLLTFHLP